MSKDSANSPQAPGWRPLADRMRPADLAEVVGQGHLLGTGKPLAQLLSGGNLHSAIFWGPPGSGKTTLARLVAQSSGARFVALSAVLAGVKDVREAIAQAQAEAARPTVLFLDEVHRFSKSQQDAFLPFVEDGTIFFIGATTENPSFAINSSLLSRARVYVLKVLDSREIAALLRRALQDTQRGLGAQPMKAGDELLERIAVAADGDARRALNLLDLAVGVARAADPAAGELDSSAVEQVVAGGWRRFDRGGDLLHDQISALHKSVRGSDPDAALYWLARMLDGGCDPHYLARRVVRMAIEDIGLADPRALTISLEAWQAYERLGSPEGDLALAQAVVFLACAAKSNAVYQAFDAARAEVERHGTLEVPLHIRNAPTDLLRKLGHGAGYRYAHDEPDAFASGETYLPEALVGSRYYEPSGRGLEIRIGEKLAELRARNVAARGSRGE
ncbi:MAG: replication-associated recombination protein A [Gammaproteobacteria bacterium]|nr:replication-associated recombination protein A [Gammaproteobacteria bacterium]